MAIDREKRYEEAELFFCLEGSVTMRLSRTAAMNVCQQAAAKGVLIIRVEGGRWLAPGFEARLDGIWEGESVPVSAEEASRNNERARAFIQSRPSMFDAFILTTEDFA